MSQDDQNKNGVLNENYSQANELRPSKRDYSDASALRPTPPAASQQNVTPSGNNQTQTNTDEK